jgi:uncharacterized protein (TIRG00374 family)
MNYFQGKFSRKTVIRNIIILAILGLAIHLIMPQIATLEKSWQLLSKMLFYAVFLSIIAQVVSYIGFGYLLQKTLEIFNLVISLGRSTLIVLGASSIGLVAGGTVGNSAAIFSWTRKKQGTVGGATLASLLPSLFNSLTLVVFSIFGVAHLLIAHDLGKTQLVGFVITLVFLAVVILISIFASHYRNQATHIVLWISRKLAALRHKSFEAESVEEETSKVFTAWDDLWKGKWYHLVFGAFVNSAFDMLTLYFLFLAMGNSVTFGELLSGYSLPLLLGKVAFFLPGGVGVVESGMAALYTSLGIPNATAVVAVLSYRLISFWIPSITGFPIAAYLTRTSTSKSSLD